MKPLTVAEVRDALLSVPGDYTLTYRIANTQIPLKDARLVTPQTDARRKHFTLVIETANLVDGAISG